MRILHVVPSLSSRLGGPTEVVINLVNELERLGVQTEIATTDDDGAGRLDVPLHCLSRYRGAAVWFYPREIFSRKEFIPSRDLASFFYRSIPTYDLVDIHYLFTFSSSMASYVCTKKRVPYTIRTMGQLAAWSLKQRALLKTIYSRTVDRNFFNNSSLIHCTTEGEASDVKAYGINKPIKVLPLGVHQTDLIPDSHIKLRKHFNLPSDAQIILFLSRLHEKKRPELLIELLKDINKSKPPHLIIAGQGGGEYLETLKEKVIRHGVQDRVHFAGFVGPEQRSELLQGCDLFVLPSHSDNFALAVAEALEAGAAVITSSEVQISPDIVQAECGIVLDNCDTQLQGAIEDLLLDREKRINLGIKARNMAHQRYSWPAIAKQLVVIYENILANNKSNS